LQEAIRDPFVLHLFLDHQKESSKTKAMKKIILICICLISTTIAIHAQTAKWFVGFPTGYVFGGPATSMKSLMTDQGFNQTSNGLFGSVSFPSKLYIPPLMVMAGKQISSYGSLYILMGQSDASTVEGYDGYHSLSVHFNIFQATLGYQFTFPQSHFKLGIGPSLFVFHQTLTNYIPDTESTETKPGVSLMARIPFGKENKLFGMELFFAMNVAESVHLNDIHETFFTDAVDMTGGKLSMVSAMLGLNFVFRK
jgi:hypothetical protein